MTNFPDDHKLLVNRGRRGRVLIGVPDGKLFSWPPHTPRFTCRGVLGHNADMMALRWSFRIVACPCSLVLLSIAFGGGTGTANPPLMDQRVEQRASALRDELTDDEFHVFDESPFVVIGNEDVQRVRRRSQGTIRWAFKRLRRDFFPIEPTDPIEVWLLRDEASYRTISRSRFGVEPTTPFGYFSAAHGALIINVHTGAGTIVHEMVHPLMAVNFPKCPAWLNEGLASLYEQCGDRAGRIWGYPNWRLRRLQAAIRDQRLASLEALCHSTNDLFYRDRSGMNYAQARYLCLYLQENGRLREFYHRFRRDVACDPSGYETLRQVWGGEAMVDFQQRWEQFVLGLEFSAREDTAR